MLYCAVWPSEKSYSDDYVTFTGHLRAGEANKGDRNLTIAETFYILQRMWNRVTDFKSSSPLSTTFPGSSPLEKSPRWRQFDNRNVSGKLLPFASQSPVVAEEKKKNPRAVESETEKKQLAFFNSLHTDARFHVGAIWYYVSLHTPVESTFYAFFQLYLKTRFSFLSFPFAAPFMCTYFAIFIR